MYLVGSFRFWCIFFTEGERNALPSYIYFVPVSLCAMPRLVFVFRHKHAPPFPDCGSHSHFPLQHSTFQTQQANGLSFHGLPCFNPSFFYFPFSWHCPIPLLSYDCMPSSILTLNILGPKYSCTYAQLSGQYISLKATSLSMGY